MHAHAAPPLHWPAAPLGDHPGAVQTEVNQVRRVSRSGRLPPDFPGLPSLYIEHCDVSMFTCGIISLGYTASKQPSPCHLPAQPLFEGKRSFSAQSGSALSAQCTYGSLCAPPYIQLEVIIARADKLHTILIDWLHENQGDTIACIVAVCVPQMISKGVTSAGQAAGCLPPCSKNPTLGRWEEVASWHHECSACRA
jgi:hypothetical protein